MRIISLVPSVTETLFELGLDEQIVAITRFCKLPADKVQSKIKVGGTKSPSLQKILDLDPDVVIMDCDENRKQDAEFLEQHGVRVFARMPKTIEDSIHLIEELGEFFEALDRAKTICRDIKQKLNESQKSLRSIRTLILIWQNPFMTINRDTYCDAICRHFGLQNVFGSHTDRFPVLRAEEIRACNAQVVLFPDEPFPFQSKHIEQFTRLFQDLPAVQNNKCLSFDGTYITWHGYGMLRCLREFPAVLLPSGLA